MSDDRARLARKLLRSRAFGVLSTHSRDVPGYPFGSITPYVLDDRLRPIILISTLAQHTRNIQADPRVSLTVWDKEIPGDQQASGRVTYMADAKVLPDGATRERTLYLRSLPEAEGHFKMHDFKLHALELKRVRYIGGFGQIFWVEPEEFRLENPLIESEAGILEHMNRDHQDALKRLIQKEHGTEPQAVTMVGVDPEGFDVRGDGRRFRFEFEGTADTPDEVRQHMIHLIRGA